MSAVSVRKKATENFGKVSRPKQRRDAVIKASVEGKSARQIAAELDISPRRVEQIQEEPETQLKIAELLQPHTEKVKRITARVVETIENDLGGKTYLERSAARRDFVALLNLAQPKGEQATPGLIQFNQLNILVQQIVQKRDGA